MVCDTENCQCMLHSCEKCPGRPALQTFVEDCFERSDIDSDDKVRYKQWLRCENNRTSLTTIESVSEFIERVCISYDALLQHQFITKSQASFMRECKEKLDNQTALILLDFAENYSFIVQDPVQGRHWDNSQATLHPFVVYHHTLDGIKSISFCIISDSLKHDTTAVHAFIGRLTNYLKESLPELKKIIYVSDGCAAQYKNFKNLINLCSHQKDFGLSAEWHFFSTSHGKSPCDGIGGTVKRLVARASLKATVTDQILTAKDTFDWSVTNIQGIHFTFVSTDDIAQNAVTFDLENRYASVKTVPGTRSHHAFIPITESTFHMHHISTDIIHSSVNMAQNSSMSTQSIDLLLLQPGKYIARIYDNEWYIGSIIERSETQFDVQVNFMR
ncbi:hypothetical protein HOLleu_28419 [Holothuria leucospilota]|uniref:Uncharacterized protein n=1 Tax=Holothuria leucospilota TaxID=206669 RepID=A0A9Q1H0V1_HOLLE|nr:hypothetical protein HOLleu_28419 [Holothuria leucospilota]